MLSTDNFRGARLVGTILSSYKVGKRYKVNDDVGYFDDDVGYFVLGLLTLYIVCLLVGLLTP